MKNKKIIIISALCAFALGFYFFLLPSIQLEWASSATYKETDKAQYNHYTPDILKVIPRVSNDYYFNYSNQLDLPFTLWSLTFDNVDADKYIPLIEDFLKNNDFKKVQCSDGDICWKQAKKPDYELYVYPSIDNTKIAIQLFYEHGT